MRIVRRSDAVGLEVLPKHWIVETNVSVAQPQSRFARDLERYPTPSKDLFASKRSASSSGGSLQNTSSRICTSRMGSFLHSNM